MKSRLLSNKILNKSSSVKSYLGKTKSQKVSRIVCLRIVKSLICFLAESFHGNSFWKERLAPLQPENSGKVKIPSFTGPKFSWQKLLISKLTWKIFQSLLKETETLTFKAPPSFKTFEVLH